MDYVPRPAAEGYVYIMRYDELKTYKAILHLNTTLIDRRIYLNPEVRNNEELWGWMRFTDPIPARDAIKAGLIPLFKQKGVARMKSLEILEYIKIIKKREIRMNYTAAAWWMKEWDEARTNLNPNARWYDEEEGTNEKDIDGPDIVNDTDTDASQDNKHGYF